MSKAMAAPAAAGSTLRERIRDAPTPRRLRAFLYAIWALSGLLFLAGEGTLSGARSAMKTVGQDTAPSIIAAQEISSALADLDASAGNYLIGSKVHQVAAARVFEQRRVRITTNLVDAASNITYGEAERVPINTLFDGLGRYLEMVAEMRARKDDGDHPGAALTYAAATDLVHRRLLPAADGLDHANRAHLDIEYRRQRTRSAGAEALAGSVGLLLLAILLWAQWFVLRRMRRILNLPLLGATISCALFTLYLVTRIGIAREDLRIAKEDAFESIHALWKARAIAYDANGDETRYLLGGAPAQGFERAYHDKVRRLASAPQPDESVFAKRGPPPTYTGLFADELRNITFPGEREAAARMIRAFAGYDAIDGRIRALERSGKHDQAVDLCIGLGADQSNATFDRFDRALLDVLEINRRAFDATIERGQDGLRTAAVLAPLASIVIAVLALLGLRPRLREYGA
jgi:hypothetical protein